jgi:hypothetical protein
MSGDELRVGASQVYETFYSLRSIATENAAQMVEAAFWRLVAL